jgi:predicted nucleotidyltransferase
MRLTPSQIAIIQQIVRAEVGAGSVVRLFGSRLDDAARGGDIDLLVEMPDPVEQPALLSARLAGKLIRAFDGRHVDVVLSAPNLQILPIHQQARKGVVL